MKNKISSLLIFIVVLLCPVIVYATLKYKTIKNVLDAEEVQSYKVILESPRTAHFDLRSEYPLDIHCYLYDHDLNLLKTGNTEPGHCSIDFKVKQTELYIFTAKNQSEEPTKYTVVIK